MNCTNINIVVFFHRGKSASVMQAWNSIIQFKTVIENKFRLLPKKQEQIYESLKLCNTCSSISFVVIPLVACAASWATNKVSQAARSPFAPSRAKTRSILHRPLDNSTLTHSCANRIIRKLIGQHSVGRIHLSFGFPPMC